MSKEIKLNRKKKGLSVFDAGLGENPMPPPQSIVNSIKKYSDRKEYTSVDGIEEMKIMLGNKIIVGNGLKPLIYIAQLAFVKIYPDAAIVHITPCWLSYTEHTRIIGCKTYQIQCPSDTWKLTPELLDCELSKINNLCLVVFNNPTNPSGCVYSKKEVYELSLIFKQYKCIVLSDDIYLDNLHKGIIDIGCIKNYYDNVIHCSSLSKGFACGGYRIGWMVFPESNLYEYYDQCLTLCSCIYSCPSVMLQYTAANALSYPDDILKQLSFQAEMFANIRDYCYKRFTDMRIKCSNSQASWYFLLDFEEYTDKLKKIEIYSSTDLCYRLIKDIGFITVSGCVFSVCKQCVLRYAFVDIQDINIQNNSYNYNNLKQGLEELDKWLNKL